MVRDPFDGAVSAGDAVNCCLVQRAVFNGHGGDLVLYMLGRNIRAGNNDRSGGAGEEYNRCGQRRQ